MKALLWLLRLLLLLFLFNFVYRYFRLLSKGRPTEGPVLTADVRYLVIEHTATPVYLAERRAHEGDPVELHDGIVLGRGDGADVVVDDPTVSQRHARFVLRSGQYWMEDLTSTNGTYLNGERVLGELPLREGDRIEIGQIRLRCKG